MARKVVTTYISDLSGKEAEETIDLHLDGISRRLDLTSSEAQKLRKVVEPYLEKGQKIPRSEKLARRKTGSNAAERQERARIRSWAQENGYDIGDRGRIAAEIQEAYYAAG